MILGAIGIGLRTGLDGTQVTVAPFPCRFSSPQDAPRRPSRPDHT